MTRSKFRFEVAFSFAGDNKRDIVREIAVSLQKEIGKGKIFFDEWFESELAGPDAQVLLQNIYETQARLVVACICDRYSKKPWTQDEWRAILSFERKLRDVRPDNIRRMRLLLLRFGDGDVDGVFDTAIVPDVRGRTVNEISELILHRLNLTKKTANKKNVSGNTQDTGFQKAAEAKFQRPQICDGPSIDEINHIVGHFVGREGLLEDIAAYFRQLLYYKTTGSADWSGARLIWIYGLGGMGKSWLVRAAFNRAVELGDPAHKLNVGLIDWHSPLWRDPLSSPPRNSRDMLDAIAYRLAQLYGVELFDRYWESSTRVDAASVAHAELMSLFNKAAEKIRAICASENPDALLIADKNSHVGNEAARLSTEEHLRDVLRDFGFWPPHPHDRELAIFEAFFNTNTRQEIFRATAVRLGQIDPAICRPDDILADALQECIRCATSHKALVLILDTCEYLTSSMHSILRKTVTPILRDESRFTLVIASRSQPDVEEEQGYGSWLSDVPERRRRIIPFDRNQRFNVDEVAKIIAKIGVFPSAHLMSFSKTICRLTMGMPMAIEPLLRMYNQDNFGSFEKIQFDLQAGSITSHLDEEKAYKAVLEIVADRFLVHLNRNADREDFRDTVAITLLRRSDLNILRLLWGITKPEERLRRLSKRYSLMDGGELHDEVRQILRHRWRERRPPEFDDVLARLMSIIEAASPDEILGTIQDFEWRLDVINLEFWFFGQKAIKKFGGLLAIALVMRFDTEELTNLLSEVHVESDIIRRDVDIVFWMRAWPFFGGLAWNNDLMSWFMKQDVSSWKEEERACRALLLAMSTARRKEYDRSIHWFEEALVYFKEINNLSDADDIISTYLDAVFWHTIDHKNDPAPLVRASEWAARLGVRTASIWHKLGNLAHNLENWTSAIAAYRRAIAQEPNEQSHYLYLAHIYEHHVVNLDQAEAIWRDALRVDPKNAEAWRHLGEIFRETKRPDDAIKAFRKSITLMPNPATLANLAVLLMADPMKRKSALIAVNRAFSRMGWYTPLRTQIEVIVKLGSYVETPKRVAAVRAAAAETPENDSDWQAIALLAEDFLSKIEVWQLYERWLLAKPDSQVRLQNFAWSVFFLSKDIKLARLHLKEASQLASYDSSSRFMSCLFDFCAGEWKYCESEILNIIAGSSHAESWERFCAQLRNCRRDEIFDHLKFVSSKFKGIYLQKDSKNGFGLIEINLTIADNKILGTGADREGSFDVKGSLISNDQLELIQSYPGEHSARHRMINVYGALVGRLDVELAAMGSILLWPES